MKFRYLYLSGLSTAAVFLTHCGSKNDASTATSTESSGGGSKSTTTPATEDPSNSSEAALLNTLAGAVPGNLSLTAFSTTSSTSLALVEGEEVDPSEFAGKPPEKEIKENLKILAGKADSCLAEGFKKPFQPPKEENCYEFDSDMVQVSSTQGQSQGAGPQASSRTLGTPNGLSAKKEACLVSFARSQIVKIKDPLDRAQNILNAALCQANKDAKDAAVKGGKADEKIDLIPDTVGKSLDLAPALKNALSKGGRTKEVVSSIKMTRLADVNGLKVYQSIFNLKDDQDNTRIFTLNHSPKDASNEEYSGILYFAVKPPKGKRDPMASSSGATDMVFYVSISYVRAKNEDGTYAITYEARIARFASGIDPILASGLLDYNASADFSVASGSQNYGMYKKEDGSYYAQANEAANSFSNITVSNTETSAGVVKKQLISYWMNPGSNYTENARGMVFMAEPDSKGQMMGCAASGSASVDMGSGLSIRRSIKERDEDSNDSKSLKPRGFYHPFINTENQQGVSSNGTGTYKYSKTQQGGMTTSWAELKATGPDAVDFVTKQVAALMTSQCFKQNTSTGLYEIDSEKTTGADGYDIVKTNDSVKAIAPPPPPRPPMKDAAGDFKPADITKATAQ